MTIGERIRQARRERGLTQKQLGELSRTSETTVKQYELGTRQPRLEQLRLIADALNADIIYLISGQTATEVEGGILIQAEAEARVELKKLQSETKDRPFDERISLNSSIVSLLKMLGEFSSTGHKKAVERVEELTEIPRYRRQDVPQSTSVSQEGNDTTPPPDAPETPAEDK